MDNLNTIQQNNLLQVIIDLSKRIRLLETEILKLKKRVQTLEEA